MYDRYFLIADMSVTKINRLSSLCNAREIHDKYIDYLELLFFLKQTLKLFKIYILYINLRILKLFLF